MAGQKGDGQRHAGADPPAPRARRFARARSSSQRISGSQMAVRSTASCTGG